MITFAQLDAEKSRVSVQIRWEPDGLTEIVGSVIGSDDRQVRTDLYRFKEFIELQGQATGAWRGNVDPEN